MLTRVAANSPELAVDRGYFASVFERGERDPTISPLHVGAEIALARMRVHVIAERDGMPTRVRFALAGELSERRLFAWQGRALTELPIPSIGETLHIAPASGM